MGYSLLKNVAVGRENSVYEAINQGPPVAPRAEAPHRGGDSTGFLYRRARPQQTLSPQTENSPTLLKTAKEKNQNEILAVSKHQRQNKKLKSQVIFCQNLWNYVLRYPLQEP